MILKAALLAALVKLLEETGNPGLCAGIYAGGGIVISLLFGSTFGSSIPVIILAAAVSMGLAYGYFWLLERLESLSLVWWIVLLGGLAIGMV